MGKSPAYFLVSQGIASLVHQAQWSPDYIEVAEVALGV